MVFKLANSIEDNEYQVVEIVFQPFVMFVYNNYAVVENQGFSYIRRCYYYNFYLSLLKSYFPNFSNLEYFGYTIANYSY